jgi:hypothetical protein
MKTIYFFILASLSFSANAQDEFGTMKCGEDVAKAVIGKRTSSDSVKKTEGAHKNLGLKFFGTYGVDDPYLLLFWEICDDKYLFLVDRHKKGIIADVIKVPKVEKDFLEALPGTNCMRGGAKEIGDIYAILDKKMTINRVQVPVRRAWKIDQTKMKFVSLSSVGLSCEKSYDPSTF